MDLRLHRLGSLIILHYFYFVVKWLLLLSPCFLHLILLW
jgi:hypothetical protein